MSLGLLALVTTATVAIPVIEEIVVTASRTEQPADEAVVAVEVISRGAIERSGAESVAELLEEHVGVQVDRSFRGATLEMQGLSSDYVLVLVDGQRAIGRVDGGLDLSRFPVDRIERIEVVKGASSALYGADALGGVVNIITRGADEDLEADARVVYGTFSALDVAGSVAGVAGPMELRLSAGWHRADAYDLSPADPGTSGSAFDAVEVDGRASYALDEGSKWIASASYWQRALDGVDASSVATYDRKNRQRQLALTVGPDLRIASGGRLRITAHGAAFYDQYLRDQRGASTLDEVQETQEQIGQISAQLDHLVGPDHLVSVGAEGLFQRFASDRLEQGSGTRGRVAAFVQDEWDVFEGVVLVPGARVDVDSQFGAYATPKLALRVTPFERVVFRANVGRGFKSPSFKDLFLVFENPTAGYVVQGNPNLGPERSWSFQAGVEVRPHRVVRVTVDTFRNDVDDLITPVSRGRTGAGEPELFTYVNVAEARTQGIESRLRLRAAASLEVEVGYRLLEAIDETTGLRLEGRAAHRFTVTARGGYAPWGVHLTARAAIVGARPFYVEDDAPPTIAAAYATVDARVEKSLFDDRCALFGGIDNITDAGDARFLPIPPRALYAGLQGRLPR